MMQDELYRLQEENALLQEEQTLLRAVNLALREENALLREEVTTLRALVADLLPLKGQVEQLSDHIKALERKLAKDSHNSHLPPSSDRFGRQPRTKSLREPGQKKPGAQPGHPGSTLQQSRTPDEIIRHQVHSCGFCQQNLQAEPVLRVERRQVVDLPPKRLVVTEHQAEQKQCPHCQQITRASFPPQVTAPVQYGPAFGAVAVYLVQQQLLPYERACETMQDLLGPSLRVGTLVELVNRCAQQLEPVEAAIKAHLQQAAVVHQDETGLSVLGKRLWMHVSATDTLTHYAVHPKRGSEALDAIGILPGFTGISVHDGWASYWHYGCEHALCNVHHLRELLFLEEQEHQPWAGEMKALLQAMNQAVQQAKAAGQSHLHPLEVADWQAQYEAILQTGWQANPPEPPPAAQAVRRGRRKQSTARNLLQRLSLHQESVLRFLGDFSVPFDNSQAERDIRMVKVQQKISGGFRSLAGAEAFCRIRGYISTLHKQGTHVLTALELALSGHPVSPSFSLT
jgi:transposase